MIKITERDLIRNVAEKWRMQYLRSTPDKMNILSGLLAIDKESALSEDIAKIIGNTSWTELKCDECGQYVKEIIQLGQEPDYESSTAFICCDCLCAAMRVLQPNPEPSLAATKDIAP